MAMTSLASITPHPGLRARLRQLAAGQVRAAREQLGMDHEDFAAYLGSILGWQATAAAVAHWEDGVPPPGDVLLAAAMAARDVPGPDVLTLPATATAGQRAAVRALGRPAAEFIAAKAAEAIACGQAAHDPWMLLLSLDARDLDDLLTQAPARPGRLPDIPRHASGRTRS